MKKLAIKVSEKSLVEEESLSPQGITRAERCSGGPGQCGGGGSKCGGGTRCR